MISSELRGHLHDDDRPVIVNLGDGKYAMPLEVSVGYLALERPGVTSCYNDSSAGGVEVLVIELCAASEPPNDR